MTKMEESLRALRFAALCLLAGFVSPAAAQAPAQKLIPLKVAYDGYSMTTAPMNYAVQKGIFKKYGLDVSIVYIDGGTTLSQAVVGGSINIAQNGYTPAAAAAVQGAGLVFIGGISNQLPFQLVVKGNIRNAADLKGKKIAISRLGASSDIAATYTLRHLGLKRTDVVLLQLGGEGTRTAAMLSGQIDGSLEQEPRTAELTEKGYRVLADGLAIAADYPNTSYVSTKRFTAANPDIVKRFIMGISDGIHAYKTNKEDALKVTGAFLKMQPNAALSEAYDIFTAKVYPDIPRPSMKGIQLVLEELATKVPAAAKVKPQDIVYTVPFDQLEKEGFFAKLK
ncbi:MAG: ABC transporter substrate-binding protein [Alphaproteobacteria bacterium]|nr:ABC transporter substrate-binding protein [Alphaproteobacteria bacterium]